MTADDLAADLLDALGAELPVDATLVGIPGHDAELGDPSEEAEAALRARAAGIAERAANSDDPDVVTLGVVRQQAESIVARLDARLNEYILADFMTAPGAKLASFLPMVDPVDDQTEADLLTRLAALPDHLAAVADRHRSGIAAGRTPVARMAATAIAHLDRFLALDPNPLARHRLAGDRTERLHDLVSDTVLPAFARYRDVLRTDVAPHGRDDDRPGLCHLPDGEAAYAALARMHTTTEHTPLELHRIGLDLIAELDREYAEIGARAFGLATAAEVQHRLRTDPALRWRDADELLTTARTTIERAEQVASDWFGRLPSAKCVVEPVPEADQPSAGMAYYLSPATDGSRPGTYFANTYKATERDRTTAESTAFHEGVPGHHFQLESRPGADRPAAAAQARADHRLQPRAGACTRSGWPTRWACSPTT